MILKPITIETPRLKLIGYSSRDVTSIFEKLSRVEVMKTLGHNSEEDYQKEEYKHRNGYSSYNRDFILFLLMEKVTNNIIGRCGLHNWNREHNRAEIGYNISSEEHKRKGLMTEAVSAIIDYGFNELNLNRIEALVGCKNIPSIKIIEKQLFVREGLLRQHCLVGEEYEDSILFSILDSEFAVRKEEKRVGGKPV